MPVLESTAPAPVRKRSGIFFAWFVLSLVVILALLHFPHGIELQRKLIDYDDLEVVAKMMNMDWHTYLTDWLPDRTRYAFPLRDVTIFFDKMLSPKTEGQFWVHNFALFAASFVFISMAIRKLFNAYFYLPAALVAIYALHPLQTEVIQWITCRKYLVGLLPLAIGTSVMIRWRGALTMQRLAVLCGLWMLSLASYPTAVFWIFWALFYIERAAFFKKRWFVLLLLLVFAISYLYVVGRGTGEVNSSLGNILSAYQKSFHFGYNALGRGFFNLLFPFWTFPYYRENHPLTFVGLALLFVSAFLLLFFALSLKNSKALANQPSESRAWEWFCEAGVWALGGLVFIIPIANTILGFFDFMLADRHFFFSMPFFVIALGCLLSAGTEVIRARSPVFLSRPVAPGTRFYRWQLLGVLILIPWLSASGFSIHHKVPLWENDYVLMADCAANEASARCMSQTVRRRFFKGDCNGVKDVILQSARFYKDRPPFAFEYMSEMPFYHSSCIALNAKTPKAKKVELIHGLEEFYGSSADVIFAVVLGYLENGQLNEALAVAGQYYLSGLPQGPIAVTRTLQGVYAGQMTVLCELQPSAQCSERLQRFLTVHADVNLKGGAASWGREASLLMAKRGGLR